jgi:hypothetical protein
VPIHHKRSAFAYFVRVSFVNKKNITSEVQGLGAWVCMGSSFLAVFIVGDCHDLNLHLSRVQNGRKPLKVRYLNTAPR